MATEKDFKVKNGLQVGNGLINATSGDVSLRRGGSTTNRIRIASANIYADTNLTVAGNLEVSGNFNITGDINQTSVTTLDVTDKTITVANNAGSAANANNAGLIVDTGGTLPSLLYTSAGDNWNFNKDLSIAGVADAKLEITSNSGGDPTIVFNALQANRSALFQYLDNGSNVGGYYKYSHAADEHQFGSATATNINLKIGDFKTTVFGANSASSDWVNRGLVSSVQINAANRTFSGLVMDDTGSGDGAAIGFRYDGTGYKLELATAPSSGGALSTHLTIDRLGAITTSGHLDVGNELTVLGTTILKNSGVVTIKAAPLGSTYGTGFNAITVTGTSSNPYTSTIGFSNYGETNAMVIKGANVGIGTSNPLARLHIENTTSDGIIVRTTTNAEPFIALQRNSGSNGVAVLRGLDGGHLRIDTGATGAAQTTKMTVTSEGKVGIGIIDPNALLQVEGTAMVGVNDFGSYDSADGNLMVSNGSDATSILLYNDASSYHSALVKYDTGVLSIGLNNANSTNSIKTDTAITVNADGVGIGNSAPDARLHVQSNDSSDYIAIFKQTHTSNLGTVQIDTPSDSNARPSRLDFARGGVNKWKTGMVYGDTSNGWGLSDATASGTAVQQTRFLVTPGGNVGIGTTSPGRKLVVSGGSSLSGSIGIDGSATGNQQIAFLQGGTDKAYLTYWDSSDTLALTDGSANGLHFRPSTGNVGIGNAAPYFPLHVQGATGFNGDAKNNILAFDTASATTGTGGGIAFGGYTNGTGGDVYHFGNIQGIKENSTAGNYASAMLFSTRANGATPTEKMRISSEGNVGIGTDSPDYQLHVAGAGDIKIEDTGGGSAHLHIGASTGGLRNSEWRLKTSGSADEFYIDHTYTANDGSSDVAGSGTVLTLKSDANVDVTNDIVANNAKLKAIAESNTDTAVDVFVYDTRKDSDGGAWRKRTQHTSWYNETLNTSTRGARKEFPCVAVIVAESNEVTIYDGDDPDMPMWMTFPVSNSSWLKHSGSGGCKAVVARDGIMLTGGDIRGSIVRFIADDGNVFEAGYNYEHQYITTRNSAVGPATGSISIVNNTIHDVAMTVLPNAPIDADTGLPVPTIAVGTDGGVSVIKDDGSVVDITYTTIYKLIKYIDFTKDNNIILSNDGYTSLQRWVKVYEIPSADYTSQTGTDRSGALFHYVPYDTGSSYGPNPDHMFPEGVQFLDVIAEAIATDDIGVVKLSEDNKSVAYITSDYNTGWINGDIKLATLSDTDDTNISASGNTNILSGGWTNNGSFPYETLTTSGLDITSAINTTAYGAANKTWNSVAGKTYTAYFNLTLNSGTAPTLFVQTSSSWGNGVSYQTVNGVNAFTFTATMSGSTYFNFSVNNGVATNFSVANLELYEGGVADRSRNGKGLSVFGDITKTAVATGAELVAYSGFNASNYLEQSYNSDLDFNSGDFAYCFWSNNPHTGSEYIADRSEGNGNYRTALYLSNNNGGSMNFYTRDTAATEVTGIIGTPNRWAQIWCIRRGTSHEIWVNGINKVASSLTVRDVSYASGEAVQKIGVRYNNSNHNTGKIALFRVSATAPSAEQIKKIYNDEKHLFATNAKATLYGSSDAVTALAYDDDTESLHAGTSAGRSVFQGLNRVDNTTDAVTTAISASNELVVEE